MVWDMALATQHYEVFWFLFGARDRKNKGARHSFDTQLRSEALNVALGRWPFARPDTSSKALDGSIGAYREIWEIKEAGELRLEGIINRHIESNKGAGQKGRNHLVVSKQLSIPKLHIDRPMQIRPGSPRCACISTCVDLPMRG